MAADIGVYNFSWRDMGVPTLFKMMDIVQVQRFFKTCQSSNEQGALHVECNNPKAPTAAKWAVGAFLRLAIL